MLRILLAFGLIFSLWDLTYGWSLEDRYILVDKAKYRLEIYEKETLLFSAEIGYGLKSFLFKMKRGDFLTPEGIYRITKIRPSIQYYYFLELNYPNFNDFSWAYFRGEIGLEVLKRAFSEPNSLKDSTLGKDIGIHGGGPFKRKGNKLDYHWTQGCITLRDSDLKVLLDYVKPNMKVVIINSEKPLLELLKKLAFPIKVKPFVSWEGALYLKVNSYTYWYFKILETKEGKRELLWEEWIRGRLNQKVFSNYEGSFDSNLEKRLKETLKEKINFILDPYQREDWSQWK